MTANVKTVDEPDLNQLLEALIALRDGDFRPRLPVEGTGIEREIAAVLNEIMSRNQALCEGVAHLTHEFGFRGAFGDQVALDGASGQWREMVANLNFMAGNLTGQVRD